MVLDPMVNLAAVPRKDGDDRVFVSMFEPKPKQNVQQAATQSNPMEDMDSDIPFAPIGKFISGCGCRTGNRRRSLDVGVAIAYFCD
jgi:hypothetical protein